MRLDTLAGEVNLSKLFCLNSEKVSTLKGKTLLPLGAKSFLLVQTPFQKRLGVEKEETRKSQKYLPCQHG